MCIVYPTACVELEYYSTYLIVSVEAVMLLVNLQLATTSTVDGFQPVIEVAETHMKNTLEQF